MHTNFQPEKRAKIEETLKGTDPDVLVWIREYNNFHKLTANEPFAGRIIAHRVVFIICIPIAAFIFGMIVARFQVR